MRRRLRITNVDMFGFCGRDRHPEPTDVGKIVFVLDAETWLFDGHTDVKVTELTGAELDQALAGLVKADEDGWQGLVRMSDDAYLYTFYEVVTEDGRRLTLVDFETEEVQ